jgi:outer membrane protein OmpA-like peptidoglycan-associated protein
LCEHARTEPARRAETETGRCEDAQSGRGGAGRHRERCSGLRVRSDDRWLEQAVWSADAELTCKQRFETAIAEVERALTTEGGVYLVFFAWDQADLTPVTQAVLDQVVADYARGAPTRVMVAGHADRSGSEAYNQNLSEQRARYVARALVARGVPESALDVQWFGESQPRIPTEDGVRERKTAAWRSCSARVLRLSGAIDAAVTPPGAPWSMARARARRLLCRHRSRRPRRP